MPGCRRVPWWPRSPTARGTMTASPAPTSASSTMASSCSRALSWSLTRRPPVRSPRTPDPSSRRRRVASPHRKAASALPLRGGRADMSGEASERLLLAAEELFGERSYHRTTVADICARAGMATGSFYSYYGSKAEVFAAVVRRINTELRRAMKAALEHADGGQRARERASFRVYFDMLSRRPWMDRIVRESEFIDPGLFREYWEHLARGYARGVRAAQLDRDIDARYDPEVIAFAYTGIGNFVGMRWADWTAGGRVPEDVLDDVLELLARGLAPKTPKAPKNPKNPGTPAVGQEHEVSPGACSSLWTGWG